MFNIATMSPAALLHPTSIGPIDWIIIAVVVALITVDAIRSDGGRASALMLSLPGAYLIYSLLPHALALSSVPMLTSGKTSPYFFLGITIILTLLIRRIIGFGGYAQSGALSGILIGAASAATLVVVWLSVPELSALWNFGPQVHAVFAEQYRLWWLAASYLAVVFARA